MWGLSFSPQAGFEIGKLFGARDGDAAVVPVCPQSFLVIIDGGLKLTQLAVGPGKAC